MERYVFERNRKKILNQMEEWSGTNLVDNKIKKGTKIIS